jgi:RadC-like JAB domain
MSRRSIGSTRFCVSSNNASDLALPDLGRGLPSIRCESCRKLCSNHAPPTTSPLKTRPVADRPSWCASTEPRFAVVPLRPHWSPKLGTLVREVFAVIFLDKRHRLISYQEMFQGTIDGASVRPREVVKEVLKQNAAAVILAYPHPSGVAEPSQAGELRIDFRAAYHPVCPIK